MVELINVLVDLQGLSGSPALGIKLHASLGPVLFDLGPLILFGTSETHIFGVLADEASFSVLSPHVLRVDFLVEELGLSDGVVVPA